MPPAAAPDEIAGGIRRVLATDGPLDEEALVAALRRDGLVAGADGSDAVYDVLESDGLGPVVIMGDGVYAWLPSLLAGRAFTHRLSASEVAHGYVDTGPDLEPLTMLTDDPTYHRLVPTGELTEVLTELDADQLTERGIPLDDVGVAAWLLDRDALTSQGLAAGDLLGVTVLPDGFALSKVAETEPVDDTGSRLAETLEALGAGGPVEISNVVWEVCAKHPELFTTPLPPLTDLFADAGLVTHGDWLGTAGFDFVRWQVDRRVGYLAEIHRLTEDEALAVLVIVNLYDDIAGLLTAARRVEEDGGSVDELLNDGDGPRALSVVLDREVVRSALKLLEAPAVAAAVFSETVGADVEGAAALGLFTETLLEREPPRAATPHLHWLLGKAHERLGDIGSAEQEFETATALDPTAPLPLFELARYASDRGDAEGGLSLLRRANAPEDDELVVVLQRFRPAERRDIGRNDPCWCGSGRKYKVCHRNRETVSLDDRAAWLYQKAGTYLSDGPWRAALIEVAEIRAEYWEEYDALLHALQDPLVCDAMLFEGGAFAAFVQERGDLLPDDERLLAEQWLLAERSVHEIEQVKLGSGFTARDVRTGDRVEVRERTASRSLTPGMFICARLVPAGETVQCFGGLEILGFGERDQLIALLDAEPDPDELVAFFSRRDAPPVLQNTEGDPLVLCTTTLHTEDPASLAAALDGTFERDDHERLWIEHVTTKGMSRVRATIRLDGALVTVETNSEPRMERVLETLRTLEPGLRLVDETREPITDARELARRTHAQPEGAVLDPDDPAVAEILNGVVLAHEKAWLDEPVPALHGVTPREAAADPTRRPDLVRLLEYYDSMPSGPGVMDTHRLRAALGL